jgi:hypothetical protein
VNGKFVPRRSSSCAGPETDDARFEVDVPPLELQYLARDAPAGDVREPNGWTDRQWQLSEDVLDLLTLEEARSHVPFLEHRDVRHVHQLAVLPRQVEDPLQRRQLAVDFAVRIPPFFAIVVLAYDHHVLLALQDERVHVCRGNRGKAATAEIGKQVQPDPPLELVGRSTTVNGVFSLEIVGGFVESNPIQLRVHRQAVRDVAFVELQQIDRVGFLAAVARLPDRSAVPIVLDPPDGAASVRHAHT